MRSSTILSLAAATLATASPMANPINVPYAFKVSRFNFGCTAQDGCGWNFDLAVEGVGQAHPEVVDSVICKGKLTASTQYVPCGRVSDILSLSAFIQQDNNMLHLRYEFNDPKEGAVVAWTGQQQVTSKEDQQAKEFKVLQVQARASF